jgi:hypothetical protein
LIQFFLKKCRILISFPDDSEGWARIDLTRHAGRELGRGLTHLTISGLVPSTQTNTGFADVKMVSKIVQRFVITWIQVSKMLQSVER